MRLILLALVLASGLQAATGLVVVSVDGLDNRYLAQADTMGLRIPHLRGLMKEGQVSKGVIGVVPTITWPSHTTILTGVDPVQHGILSNWRPPGERYLDYAQIKVPTLIGKAREAGLTTAAITWPVTVNAPVDWNLPEYFVRRRGGSMDARSVESKATPRDLVERIGRDVPSFPQEWMDDRTRTEAAVWLLRHEKPRLLLIHLVDLDSEEHDDAPFSREAKAILERTDDLIGRMKEAMPADYAMAVVSDHGFDRVDRLVNLSQLAPGAQQLGGIVIAPDAAVAERLRELKKNPTYRIGREIPLEEYRRFPSTLPPNPAAVFESGEGAMFMNGKTGEVFTKPEEIGNHGHWPLRYRSCYILWGPGIAPGELPEFSLKDIAGRLARVLGIPPF